MRPFCRNVFVCGLAMAACLASPAIAAELIAEISAGPDPVCVAFDPCLREFAVGKLTSKMIDIWSPDSDKEVNTLKAHDGDGILGLAYSPDGKLLASAGRDKSVRVWYVGNGKVLHILKGHKKQVNCVDFSVDGARLASGGADNVIILWDVRDGKMIREMEGHTDEVTALRFSPDGKLLATAGKDLAVRIWEADSGNWLRTMKGPVLPITCLAFAPDGKRLACGDEDGRASLFEVESGKFVKNIGQHSWGGRSNWPIRSIVFFPDGKQIITGAADGTAKVWDLTSGKFVHTIRAHVGGIGGVAMSPDGKLLVTVGASEPVRANEGYKLGAVWGKPDKKTAKVWDAASARMPLSYPPEPEGASPEPSPEKAPKRQK